MSSRLLVSLLVLTLVLGAAVAAAASLPPGGSFTDDDGNVHESNIEAIAAEAVTRGCNPPVNDLYCPSDTVTRDQMAAFLVRALSLTDGGGGNTFIDDDGSVFEADIAKLAAAGITKGCNPPANTMYCPSQAVTRGQMAALLVRAMGYTDDGGGDLFVDDDGSAFETDIDKLRTAGVTSGCNPPANTRYCPNDPVKRDQMASFLTRALGLTPIVVPPALTLNRQGLGAVGFETSLSETLTVVESALGLPDELSGPSELPYVCGNGLWGDADDCLGMLWERRWHQSACWQQLCLIFGSISNGSTPGEMTFTGWHVNAGTYGSGRPTAAPSLTTPEGIGIGSSIGELTAAYPAVTFSTSVGGIPTFDIGWTDWAAWLAPGVMSFDNYVISFNGGHGPELGCC